MITLDKQEIKIMGITFQAENIQPPLLKKREIKNWIRAVCKFHNKETGEINFLFCNNEKILEFNRKYLNHDYFTDIITFDYSNEKDIAGDIIISLETVLSNSEDFRTLYAEELHRVIIHGILHLCGFKDETKKEKEQMRTEEDRALAMLKRDKY